jgi:tetratricopeptide (TPR) repeat protein
MLPYRGHPDRARKELPACVAVACVVAFTACEPVAEDHLAKGDRFLADGKIEDARAEFRVALHRSRKPPEELLWKLGLLDLDAKHVVEARQELDALLQRDPGTGRRVAQVYLLFAARWFKAGDPFNAIQALEAARAADPRVNLGPFYYEIADYYYELADYERAVQNYLLALALAPGADDEAAYRLASALERLGRWRQALTYYRQYANASRGKDLIRDVRYRLGEAAFRSAQASFLEHRYAETLEYLSIILKSGQPETRLDDAYYLLGEVRYRAGDYAAAAAAFEKVLELSPSPSSRLYGEAERRLLDIQLGGT